MAFDKLTEYSATNASNTSVGDVDVTEGMLPSNVNNAIREIMTHLKNFAEGTDAITSIAVDGGTIKLDGNHPVGTQNVALGDTALDSNTTGGRNTAIGANAMTTYNVTDSGNDFNVAVGYNSLTSLTTGFSNTGVGSLTLESTTTGANNTACGYGALDSNTTANNNTAVGYDALTANTTGTNNVAVGTGAAQNTTTGSQNNAFGKNALYSNQTSNNNVAMGENALYTNTASNNTGIGHNALLANTTGNQNTSVGAFSLDANTTAARNTAIGYQAGSANTTGHVTAIGSYALRENTTGNSNVAVGGNDETNGGALQKNTTGSNNTAVGVAALTENTTGAANTAIGVSALQANTTASNNTAVGLQALLANTTGHSNVAFGQYAGSSLTTGTNNCFVGPNTASGASGSAMTTGSKNTILGGYNGNQGGIDIRTSSNQIVMSDGDGNPRIRVDSAGYVYFPNMPVGGAANVHWSSGNGQFFVSSSSSRFKHSIQDYDKGLSEVVKMQPKYFIYNDEPNQKQRAGFIAEDFHSLGMTEFVEYWKDENDADVASEITYGNMVAILVKSIQELKAELDTAKARIAALEGE